MVYLLAGVSGDGSGPGQPCQFVAYAKLARMNGRHAWLNLAYVGVKGKWVGIKATTRKHHTINLQLVPTLYKGERGRGVALPMEQVGSHKWRSPGVEPPLLGNLASCGLLISSHIGWAGEWGGQ